MAQWQNPPAELPGPSLIILYVHNSAFFLVELPEVFSFSISMYSPTSFVVQVKTTLNYLKKLYLIC